MKNLVRVISAILFAIPVAAQTSGRQTQMESTVCTFEDGKEISIQYDGQVDESAKLSMGQLWPHSTRPMLLFTQTPLRIESSPIPAGAFSVYVIPGKKQWTLIVNRNVTSGVEYRQQEDLVRASMETGQVSSGEKQPKLAFGRLAPKRCELRFYYGNTGASVEFHEQ